MGTNIDFLNRINYKISYLYKLKFNNIFTFITIIILCKTNQLFSDHLIPNPSLIKFYQCCTNKQKFEYGLLHND